MNLIELQKKISEILGVSESEKELAYEVLISNIVNIITEGITLKIPRIGYFQLKKNEVTNEYSLIFSSFQDPIQSKSDELYLVLNVTSYVKNSNETDENVFSIGVAKPLIPLEKFNDSDSDTSYTILRKSIEERVNEILTESDQLPYFNMWEKFNDSIEKNNITESEDSKAKLEELTADLDFKDDLIAEDITNNLLNMELKETETEIEETTNYDLPEISPTDLLQDYNTDIKKDSFNQEIEITSTNDNKLTEPYEKTEPSSEDLLKPIEEIQNETPQLDELHLSELEIQENAVKDSSDVIFDKENLNFDLEELSPNEIEVELGKKNLINEIINENDNHIINSQEEENKVISLKEPEDTISTELLDIEIEEESYLGLKKKKDEKIEWNWGDELKEEFGTTEEFDKPSFDFMDEEDFEDKDTLSNIVKKSKPEKGTMFDELEKSIQKEVEQTDKEIEYMEYSGPPPKYEFVESNKEEFSELQNNQNPSTMDSFYEDEIMNEYKNNTKERYFNKTFIAIFISFIVIIALTIYLLVPGKKAVEEFTANVDGENSTVQDISQTNTEPIDTQTSTGIIEENDFPRVASVPIKDSQTDVPITTTTPQNRPNNNSDLYRNIINDQRVNKTIFYDGTQYNIQVSSWRNREKAEQEVRRLRNKGYNSFVLIANLPEKGGTWYRVRIGSLKSQKEAEELITRNNF